MPDRKPNESIAEFTIRTCWELGHFWNPSNPNGLNIRQEDLSKLTLADPVVLQAMQSWSRTDALRYAEATVKYHKRLPNFDGELGPAFMAMLEDPVGRCPVPDYAPPPGVHFSFDDPDLQQIVVTMQANSTLPAVGRGNWPRCHGVGEAHCAIVKLDITNIDPRVKAELPTILSGVQEAYAEYGMLFRFVNQQGVDILTGDEFGNVRNIDVTWVRSAPGWIGLAIVGEGQRCNDVIWAKFLATYLGGMTTASMIQQQITLMKHEHGHNLGLLHTAGGVMNSSIVNGLPTRWDKNDPSLPRIIQLCGGEPVQIPGKPAPDPKPDPKPPIDVQDQIHSLQLQQAMQATWLKWCTDEINRINGGAR